MDADILNYFAMKLIHTEHILLCASATMSKQETGEWYIYILFAINEYDIYMKFQQNYFI